MLAGDTRRSIGAVTQQQRSSQRTPVDREPVIVFIDKLIRNGDVELRDLTGWAQRNIYASPKHDRKAVGFDLMPTGIEDVYVSCIPHPKKSRATNLLCGNTLMMLTMLLAKKLESA